MFSNFPKHSFRLWATWHWNDTPVAGYRLRRQLVLDLLQSSPSPILNDPHGLNENNIIPKLKTKHPNFLKLNLLLKFSDNNIKGRIASNSTKIDVIIIVLECFCLIIHVN